ncbi:hypothetical protein FLONG3_4738 [Fusarium longipes]|uniref:Apple domain-containing protein n=1 Tax=Fusarium longipes TaxID=694270 RepID=A0A395SXM6_9HYPO|nr:hypothetical protein FLONG3_4738 [Fusarium longipes]
MTDEHAAYKVVWADPCCDFDLKSVPELQFETTTVTSVNTQPTTLATRTSEQPETMATPANVCLFNCRQSCQMATWKLEPGNVCAYGAKVIGNQWEESCKNYHPYQDTFEQCVAICRTRSDCKGSGYKDGRCVFLPIALKTSNFRAWPDSLRDEIWDAISCFECPNCA